MTSQTAPPSPASQGSPAAPASPASPPPPSLSIELGVAERTLRGLLDSRLAAAGLAFPEWTTLTLVQRAGPLTRDDLLARQVENRVTSREHAAATADALRERGLLAEADGRLRLTAAGDALYGPTATAVAAIGSAIWGGLAADDIETARRVLIEVTRRAQAQSDG